MFALYHYIHCPYCVRVRMTLGLLNIPYESHVVGYSDTETPVKLAGKKMLPILGDGKIFMHESLDMMKLLDKNNTLHVEETVNSPAFKELEKMVAYLSNLVHSLAMPYWIWTPEFNEADREYFKNQKEKKRGPFNELVRDQNLFISQLGLEWPKLASELMPFYQSSQLTIKDILIASHLWGLYMVPEFQFPEPIHAYLQSVKKACRFDYHQDFWSQA